MSGHSDALHADEEKANSDYRNYISKNSGRWEAIDQREQEARHKAHELCRAEQMQRKLEQAERKTEITAASTPPSPVNKEQLRKEALEKVQADLFKESTDRLAANRKRVRDCGEEQRVRPKKRKIEQKKLPAPPFDNSAIQPTPIVDPATVLVNGPLSKHNGYDHYLNISTYKDRSGHRTRNTDYDAGRCLDAAIEQDHVPDDLFERKALDGVVDRSWDVPLDKLMWGGTGPEAARGTASLREMEDNNVKAKQNMGRRQECELKSTWRPQKVEGVTENSGPGECEVPFELWDTEMVEVESEATEIIVLPKKDGTLGRNGVGMLCGRELLEMMDKVKR